LCAVATALFIPAALAADAATESVLDNGLKVVVLPDHRAPVVVSQIWYKVGSGDEPSGITGISHALEHMMFQGTPAHPPGELSRIIADNGGRQNAFTTRDYTVYFQQLESSRLKVSFELESDRMHHLSLDPKRFANEIRIVMEERRLRTEDDPRAATAEIADATAYQVSPYRHPVIGWMGDLKAMTVAELRRWYRRWYAPNNATLVVVGDVDPKAVFALARQYFGAIPRATIMPEPAGDEPAQHGTKRVTVDLPAQVPYLLIQYHVPSLAAAIRNPKVVSESDAYALELIAQLLAGDPSARFDRELKRGAAVVAEAGADYNLYARRNTLFSIDAVPAAGKTAAAVEQALRAQIRALRDTPVDRAELERVKTRLIAQNVFERDSMFYQAMQIGILESVGIGWRRKDQYEDRIRAITPEQIQAVARRYLVAENMTVTTLAPQSSPVPPP
jgi:zinc protease